MEDLNLLIEKYKDQGIEILSKLISKASVLDKFDPESEFPFGKGNKECLDVFLAIGEELGFKAVNGNNYYGYLEYGTGNEVLGVLAHLDVVPVTVNEWKTDPFTLTIDGDFMYGRGTTDDKGPLVASLMALKALKDSGYIPNKRIRLIAGCDEESGSRCLEKYLEVEGEPEVAFSPDADFPVIYGEKAITSYDIIGDVSEDVFISAASGDRYNIVPSKCEFKLKKDLKSQFIEFLKRKNYRGGIDGDTYITYGLASHAMAPDKGVNAIYIMFEFLRDYTDSKLAKFIDKYYLYDNHGKKAGYYDFDPEMNDLTSNLAVIRINGSRLKLGFNVRAPKDEDFLLIKNKVTEITHPYGYEFMDLGGSPRHYVPKDSVLVKTLMKCYKDVTGRSDEPICIGGGTYAREIKNAVAFGPQKPGDPDVCHISNEYMKISDFETAIKVYYLAIKELTR